MLNALLSGLVSAAADNDPTTVGTVAVAGATTLYGLEWLLILIVPMLATIQMLGTRLAAVTHEDLQMVIRNRYSTVVALATMLAIVGVNAVTLGADLQAGAASVSMLTGVSQKVWVVPVALALAALLSWQNFARVRNIFALLPLAFLAYAGAAFLAHPDWHAVLNGFVPHVPGKHDAAITMLALLGTLLTAYAYLWQTVQVATDRPRRNRRALRSLELSTLPGLLFTFAILWFILVASAATLGVHHRTVETAQQAAQALTPLAGKAASTVFAVGLLGSSLLAVPVIAAATADVLCATFRWTGSLDDRPQQAKRYYAVIYGALLVGVAICYAGVPVITLLFIASVAGGIATPVTLAPLMLLVRDRKVMKGKRAPLWLAAAGWAVTAIVSFAAIASMVQS